MCVVSWIRHLMTGSALEGSPARRPALRSARSNVNRSLPALANITAQPHAPAQAPRPDPHRAPRRARRLSSPRPAPAPNPLGSLRPGPVAQPPRRAGRDGAWGLGLGARGAAAPGVRAPKDHQAVDLWDQD